MNITFRNLLILLLPAVAVTILWLSQMVQQNNLLFDVPSLFLVPVFETKYLYLLLHLFTLVPIFALSFDKKVHFYKKWKYLFPAIAIVGTAFIIWDVFFTFIGVWGFNENYFASIKVFELPIEEWLFFISVPFACVFIYECLNAYVKKDWLANYDKPISTILIILFFVTGFLNLGKLYTSTTFILCGSLLLYHFLNFKNTYRTRFYFSYLISYIPFIFFNGILTGGFTKNPVVIYNPEEYLGFRLVSIPIDDSAYAFLLLFSVTILFEKFRKQHIKH